MRKEKRAAIIYCRISADPEGRAVGVERQAADCRELAKRLGFTVIDAVIDNDLSASSLSTKPRPQYRSMLHRVRRGEASAILAYSNSRLTRRPREFEDLLDLHRETGVRISTVVSGEDDLSTADGRMVARFKAVADAAEAERTAERVARAKKQAAEQGHYRGGQRPYGYEADGTTVRESEAEVVRYATKHVLAGRPLRVVAEELNEQGRQARRTRIRRDAEGKPIKDESGRVERERRVVKWSAISLRAMLLRPRNAGLIHTGKAHEPDVLIIGKASWPALVDADEWRALHSMLTEPTRLNRTRDSSPRWLLSGIATCGRPGCGAVMRVTASGARPSHPNAKRQHYYRCGEVAHLTTNVVPTDEFVRRVVAGVVRDPKVIRAMTATDGDTTRGDKDRRTVLGRLLEKTEADYDNDLIDGRRYKAKTDKINAELTEIEGRLAEAAERSQTLPIFSTTDPGRAFLDSPLDIQRQVIRAVLKVTVMPAPRGPKWSPARLNLEPIVAVSSLPVTA